MLDAGNGVAVQKLPVHPSSDEDVIDIYSIPNEIKTRPTRRDGKAMLRAKKHLYYFHDKAVNRLLKHNREDIFGDAHEPAMRAAAKQLLQGLFKLGRIEIVSRKKIDIEKSKTVKNCRYRNLLCTMDFGGAAVLATDILDPFILPRDANGARSIPLIHGLALKVPFTDNRPSQLEAVAKRIGRYEEHAGPDARAALGEVREAIEWMETLLWRRERSASPNQPVFDELSERMDDGGVELVELAHPNRVAEQMRDALDGRGRHYVGRKPEGRQRPRLHHRTHRARAAQM